MVIPAHISSTRKLPSATARTASRIELATPGLLQAGQEQMLQPSLEQLLSFHARIFHTDANQYYIIVVSIYLFL